MCTRSSLRRWAPARWWSRIRQMRPSPREHHQENGAADEEAAFSDHDLTSMLQRDWLGATLNLCTEGGRRDGHRADATIDPAQRSLLWHALADARWIGPEMRAAAFLSRAGWRAPSRGRGGGTSRHTDETGLTGAHEPASPAAEPDVGPGTQSVAPVGSMIWQTCPAAQTSAARGSQPVTGRHRYAPDQAAASSRVSTSSFEMQCSPFGNRSSLCHSRACGRLPRRTRLPSRNRSTTRTLRRRALYQSAAPRDDRGVQEGSGMQLVAALHPALVW